MIVLCVLSLTAWSALRQLLQQFRVEYSGAPMSILTQIVCIPDARLPFTLLDRTQPTAAAAAAATAAAETPPAAAAVSA